MTPDSDHDLHRISEVLRNAGITFWLDSGTLLGMVRDGQLLRGDPDIDLSVWDTDVPVLLGLAETFRSGGYRCRVESYFGQVFNVTLVPRLGSGRRRIDVCVYRRSEGHAWAPALLPRTRKGRRDTGRLRLLAPWDMLLHALWARFARGLMVERWPWRGFFRLKTWWIPLEFLDAIEEHEGSGLPVPQGSAEYLAYRYGRWQSPVDDWSYWDDDGGLAPADPRVLVANEGRA